MSSLASSPGHAANPLELLKVVTWRVPAVDASLLEAVTLPAKEETAVLRALAERAGATELVHFPTCQRVLVAMVTPADVEQVRAAAHALFEARAGRPLPEPEALGGFAAFSHLSEVASALDSLVPGEPQVLGQMKDAFQKATADGFVGRSSHGLTHVFPLVFRTAKAVRTNTDLFRGKVSLIPLTLDLVQRHLDGRKDPVAVVVGTGEMGRKMAELIVDTVPGTAIERVSRAASRGRPLADFLARPPAADIVTFATRTEKPFFTRAHAEAMVRANGGRPLLVVDLSLPRCASADVADVPGVRLVALDELTALAEKAKSERHAELDRARDVLRVELDRVASEYAAIPQARRVVALRREMMDAAEARYAAGAERFPELFADPEFRKWFEQTMRSVAHVAQKRLKEPEDK